MNECEICVSVELQQVVCVCACACMYDACVREHGVCVCVFYAADVEVCD